MWSLSSIEPDVGLYDAGQDDEPPNVLQYAAPFESQEKVTDVPSLITRVSETLFAEKFIIGAGDSVTLTRMLFNPA